MADRLTHDELCEHAARWLRSTKKCRLVLREVVSYAREIPDAIGWRWGSSILVECKVSRSDFARDKKKVGHALPDWGMGEKRYYMTPPGLLSPDELPYGWGLLEVRDRSVRVVKEAESRTIDPRFYRDELQLCIRGVRMINGEDEYTTKKSAAYVGARAGMEVVMSDNKVDGTIEQVASAIRELAAAVREHNDLKRQQQQANADVVKSVQEMLKPLAGQVMSTFATPVPGRVVPLRAVSNESENPEPDDSKPTEE